MIVCIFKQSLISLIKGLSLLTLVQVLSGSSSARMPLMYQGSNYSSEELALVLPLCLSDSNFPLYVAEVESQLNKLAQGLQ